MTKIDENLKPETQKPNWKNVLIVLIWFGAIVGAFIFLSRPKPFPPPPPGWTIWRELGSTRAVLLLEDAIYAGGVEGLFFIDPDDSVEKINIPKITGIPIVNAIIRDRNGAIWVCMDQGVGILQEDGWTILREGDVLPDGRVASIKKTSDGFIWLGTATGAARLPVDGPWTKNEIFILNIENGLQHDRVQAIEEDSHSGIWFGTFGAPEGGLSRYNNGEWQYWTTANGLPHPAVLDIMLDTDGQIRVGCGKDTSGGAIILSDTSGRWQIEQALPMDEFVGPIARSFLEDSRGLWWVGSEFHGLTIRKGNDTLRFVTMDDGLPAQEAVLIAENSDGSIWLATLAGLVRIDTDAVADLLYDDDSTNGEPAR